MRVRDQRKIAKNLQAFRIAVASHDRENPAPHSPAHGIGLSAFDLDRLGFEDGEELWTGVTIHVVSMATGNFRVLCDGNHDECNLREKEERETRERERFAIEPREPVYV